MSFRPPLPRPKTVAAKAPGAPKAGPVLRRFWPYAIGDRHRRAAGGLCALVVSCCELGTVAMFDVITDRVLARRQVAGFWGPAGWRLGIVAVAALAMFCGEYVSSLASAVLRETPVLVLDEPTSGLSLADTRAVLRLLGPVMAGRTTIVITHDEAVAAQAGYIVTLSEPGVAAARS